MIKTTCRNLGNPNNSNSSSFHLDKEVWQLLYNSLAESMLKNPLFHPNSSKTHLYLLSRTHPYLPSKTNSNYFNNNSCRNSSNLSIPMLPKTNKNLHNQSLAMLCYTSRLLLMDRHNSWISYLPIRGSWSKCISSLIRSLSWWMNFIRTSLISSWRSFKRKWEILLVLELKL